MYSLLQKIDTVQYSIVIMNEPLYENLGETHVLVAEETGFENRGWVMPAQDKLAFSSFWKQSFLYLKSK
jgi:hypothetical protein